MHREIKANTFQQLDHKVVADCILCSSRPLCTQNSKQTGLLAKSNTHFTSCFEDLSL